MNLLAQHYSKFKVTERILLTGHSHQAWPDCSFAGQEQAWLDAAEFVDAKWGKVFEKTARVQKGFANLMHDTSGHYALAASTHDLVIRFLSALPLKKRSRIVTTDCEFHSLKRQLTRLQEEGLEVHTVAAHPVESLPQRLIDATTDRTAAVMVSTVFFNSAHIAPDLKAVHDKCVLLGVELLLDVYHQLNVVPFSIKGIESAFVVGGGYKYCQLGEGNCFLRFPAHSKLRPIVTGWMADFAALENAPKPGALTEYSEGSARFAGATFDPASAYRASAVFDFFEREKLSPVKLREISQRHMKLLCHEFDALDLSTAVIKRDTAIALQNTAGFLALTSPHAHEFAEGLKKLGVFTDYRGTVLRLGSAPYISDSQLKSAIQSLGQIARALTR